MTATTTAPAQIIRAQYLRTVPKPNHDYIAPTDFLAGLTECARIGQPVAMIGAAGTGKTEAAMVAAARLGRPFVKVDASAVTFAPDWFGNLTSTGGGSIAWQDSTLVSALEDDENAPVILIDEINRADARALNGLLGLLDWTRTVSFPQRSAPIVRSPRVAIFASANVGIEYSGTGALCRALSDRFQLFETDYMNTKEETALLVTRTGIDANRAGAFARLAAYTRTREWCEIVGGVPISTRALLDAARLSEAYAASGASRMIALRSLLTRQPRESFGNASAKSPRDRLSAWVTTSATEIAS